jgi:hypothetical protein
LIFNSEFAITNTEEATLKSLIMTIKTNAYQRWLGNILLLLLCIFITITITYIYLSNEHTFYYWDYANYSKLTSAKAIDFQESPIKALYKVWESTGRDYSDIPTLLLVPFILTFGDSRLVFILSMALVYVLPYALTIGAIAAKLVSYYPRTVYWFTVLLTLFTPMVWAPTLRGYPDVGSALLIALAILVYLQDLQLKQWWQVVLSGFFISVAILFRRHFVYDGIAFFASVTLQTLILYAANVRQNSCVALRNLLKTSVRLGLMVGTSLITLVVLGLPFIKMVLSTNFSLLYASYEVSITEGIRYYGYSYGWLAWILAGLGFVAGIRTRVLVHPVAIFIVLFSSILLLQWLMSVKVLGVHYTLHFTLLVVLGLIAFCWTAWITINKRTRILVVSASIIYFILNAFIGLASVEAINNTQISKLFSANYPPLNRSDYDEIIRLVNYLSSVASAKEPIYVAASSIFLNQSILSEADLILNQPQHKLNILPSPDIDSRDYYPLEQLLQAQYLVVATPFQHHLRPEEQKVVKVVVDAFNNNWKIAQDFIRLPVQFSLANNAVVKVYKRLQKTSLETTLYTLKQMHNYIGLRPGQQSDWLKISEEPNTFIWFTKHRNNTYDIQINPNSGYKPSTTSFLHLNRLPKDRIGIAGQIKYQSDKSTEILMKQRATDNKCYKMPNLSLYFDTVNAQGELVGNMRFQPHSSHTSNFAEKIQAKGADYLLFKVNLSDDVKDPVNLCSLSITSLDIFAK